MHMTRSPGEFIRDELKSRGGTQDDLARVLNRPLPTVNEIIQGKRGIMPEMAIALGSAFDMPPEVWMEREGLYRLSLAGVDKSDDVRRRSKLYALAPIKEIQKRGWITASTDLDVTERDILRLLEIKSIEQEPTATGVMRKTRPDLALTPAQRAWFYRVRHLASALQVSRFDDSKMGACQAELRRLAAYSKTASKVPAVLGKYGIRFVVVEPLTGGKVDGVATWLSDTEPVIGMSIRFDRLDSFWFTLGHEMTHIRHRDASPLDTDLTYQGDAAASKSDIEIRADEESAAMFIPPAELKSFILRSSPIYSKERINQFANRIKILPGLIVGQLQHRREIGYHANRDTLTPIRAIVTSTALTDGWNHTIDQRVSS